MVSDGKAIPLDQVLDALRQVVDPELGINIVDLGLVYHLELQDAHVQVTMTMTTPACPLSAYLKEKVETSLRQQIPDIQSVEVRLVWDPPWRPTMVSEAARQQLGQCGRKSSIKKGGFCRFLDAEK